MCDAFARRGVDLVVIGPARLLSSGTHLHTIPGASRLTAAIPMENPTAAVRANTCSAAL